MSGKPKIENCGKVLIVEGYGDLLFFAEALEHLENLDRVFIKEFNGASDLLIQLETFLSPALLSTKESIAVVLDADSDASARKQSLSNTLQKISNRQLEHGIWSEGKPNLGFFVVPDGQQQGEIETLAWNAWSNTPDNQVQKNCIETFLQCMSDAGFESQSPDKGKISSLLAVRYDDDPRLGPGARANVFDFHRPEYKPLFEFLSQL